MSGPPDAARPVVYELVVAKAREATIKEVVNKLLAMEFCHWARPAAEFIQAEYTQSA